MAGNSDLTSATLHRQATGNYFYCCFISDRGRIHRHIILQKGDRFGIDPHRHGLLILAVSIPVKCVIIVDRLVVDDGIIQMALVN